MAKKVKKQKIACSLENAGGEVSELEQKVLDAIDEMFSDMSVSQGEAKSRLKGIIFECQAKIDCLDLDQAKDEQ